MFFITPLVLAATLSADSNQSNISYSAISPVRVATCALDPVVVYPSSGDAGPSARTNLPPISTSPMPTWNRSRSRPSRSQLATAQTQRSRSLIPERFRPASRSRTFSAGPTSKMKTSRAALAQLNTPTGQHGPRQCKQPISVNKQCICDAQVRDLPLQEEHRVPV